MMSPITGEVSLMHSSTILEMIRNRRLLHRILSVSVIALLVGVVSEPAFGAKPFCGNNVCEGNEQKTCPLDCESTPDPGGGGEPIPELVLKAEQPAAHDGDDVRAVGFAADGGGGARVVSGGEDANLRSWTQQLDKGPVYALDHTIYDLEPSFDGSIVVTGEGGWNGGTDSDTLRIWNADGFLLVGTRAPIGYVYVVTISPNKRWTAASGFYGDIVVYDTTNLELHATKATKKKRTKALAFSPDGSIIASTSTAGRIQLWSFPQLCSLISCELELIPVSLGHSGSWFFPIDFSPDSTSEMTKIVSGTDGGMIKLWTIENLDNARPSVSFTSVDSGAVYSLAWSPDGSKIVAGGDGDITVYKADTLEILFQNVDAHASRVNDVAFSPDNSQIASGGDDGSLKLWSFVVQ